MHTNKAQTHRAYVATTHLKRAPLVYDRNKADGRDERSQNNSIGVIFLVYKRRKILHKTCFIDFTARYY